MVDIQTVMGETRCENVDGIRVRYVRAGAGPSVLLLHGMMGALSHWEPVVAPLAAHADVVALDLPPFGASDKPPLTYSLAFYADFLTRFARRLALCDVTLVGHSFGGKLATYTAAMHPEWVAGLVLVASDGFQEKPKRYRRASTEWQMRLLCRVAPPLLPLARRLFFTRGSVVPPAFTSDAVAFFRDREAPRALAAVSRSEAQLDLPTSDAAPLLPHLAIPVGIVQGLDDGAMGAANARRAAAIFPHAQLTLLPGVGHVAQIERPAAVTDAVLRVLAARETAGVAATSFADPIAPTAPAVPVVATSQEDGNA